MTIEEIYQLVNFICNKYQSGSFSPGEANRVFPLVNTDMFKVYAGLPEQYQNGMPPAMNWQANQRITDTVRHLHKITYIPKNSSGYYPLPVKYGAFSSIMVPLVENAPECDSPSKLEWRKCEVVTESERTNRIQSQLLEPTLKYPIAAFYSGGLLIDPEQIKRIRLAYLKFPEKPIRNYTGQDIYDPTGSVNFEWPETVHNDIVIRCCYYIGIFIREQELVQFSQERKIRGN